MKVAITGASGYLGASLVETFRDHGHEVLSLSRQACGESWASYSLRDDPQQLPLEGVDVLIHAAYDFTARSWREIVDTNVDPSIALFQTASASVRKLVFISSMSSFDGCHSNYGRAKWMIEKEVLRFGGLVIRPGLVWGESPGGVMGALERAVAEFPVIPFPSGGKGAMQFLVHRSDLSKALVAFSQVQTLHRGVRSLAHPTALSLREILGTIASRQLRSRTLLPVPWRCVMAGLKSAEMLRIPVPFRSDSLVGLVHGDPDPQIASPPAGVTFRPFA